MNEFDKIDEVLKFVINCEQPSKRKATEIANELDFRLTTKEIVEILDKLNKDCFVIKEIQTDDIAYYFSTFEGRLFLKSGGYKSQYKSEKRKKVYGVLMAVFTITNILAISILTFLTYRATDKANDNKEEITKFNSNIEHLVKSNDSLRDIILTDTTKK